MLVQVIVRSSTTWFAAGKPSSRVRLRNSPVLVADQRADYFGRHAAWARTAYSVHERQRRRGVGGESRGGALQRDRRRGSIQA